MATAASFLRMLSGRWGRISTGFAALSAMAVGLWPEAGSTINIEKSLAFAAALSAWLWAELAGADESHPHDVKLFKQLLETIDPDERLFLKQHDMGDLIRREYLKGTRRVAATWQGASFDYNDRDMQKRWKSLYGEISTFRDLFANYTVPMKGDADFATVKSRVDIETGDRSPRTLANTKELNDSATRLVEALDEFERFGRERLRV